MDNNNPRKKRKLFDRSSSSSSFNLLDLLDNDSNIFTSQENIEKDLLSSDIEKDLFGSIDIEKDLLSSDLIKEDLIEEDLSSLIEEGDKEKNIVIDLLSEEEDLPDKEEYTLIDLISKEDLPDKEEYTLIDLFKEDEKEDLSSEEDLLSEEEEEDSFDDRIRKLGFPNIPEFMKFYGFNIITNQTRNGYDIYKNDNNDELTAFEIYENIMNMESRRCYRSKFNLPDGIVYNDKLCLEHCKTFIENLKKNDIIQIGVHVYIHENGNLRQDQPVEYIFRSSNNDIKKLRNLCEFVRKNIKGRIPKNHTAKFKYILNNDDQYLIIFFSPIDYHYRLKEEQHANLIDFYCKKLKEKLNNFFNKKVKGKSLNQYINNFKYLWALNKNNNINIRNAEEIIFEINFKFLLSKRFRQKSNGTKIFDIINWKDKNQEIILNNTQYKIEKIFKRIEKNYGNFKFYENNSDNYYGNDVGFKYNKIELDNGRIIIPNNIQLLNLTNTQPIKVGKTWKMFLFDKTKRQLIFKKENNQINVYIKYFYSELSQKFDFITGINEIPYEEFLIEENVDFNLYPLLSDYFNCPTDKNGNNYKEYNENDLHNIRYLFFQDVYNPNGLKENILNNFELTDEGKVFLNRTSKELQNKFSKITIGINNESSNDDLTIGRGKGFGIVREVQLKILIKPEQEEIYQTINLDYQI